MTGGMPGQMMGGAPMGGMQMGGGMPMGMHVGNGMVQPQQMAPQHPSAPMGMSGMGMMHMSQMHPDQNQMHNGMNGNAAGNNLARKRKRVVSTTTSANPSKKTDPYGGEPFLLEANSQAALHYAERRRKPLTPPLFLPKSLQLLN